MFGMTMTVIATVYLDKTDQWEKLGVDRRKKAIEHIQTGRLSTPPPNTKLT